MLSFGFIPLLRIWLHYWVCMEFSSQKWVLDGFFHVRVQFLLDCPDACAFSVDNVRAKHYSVKAAFRPKVAGISPTLGSTYTRLIYR
jgi:hypothetical protein